MQSHDTQLLQAVKFALGQDKQFQAILQQARTETVDSDSPLGDLKTFILNKLTTNGGLTFACNKAFTAKQRLSCPSSHPTDADTTVTEQARCKRKSHQLQGLPAESISKAKQAWQKLLVDRLHYLRAKVNLPLVSPRQDKPAIPTDTATQADTASARIASGDQPFFSAVPLLQDSYCVGIADWYSLVMTLLSSHWDSISSFAAQLGQAERGKEGTKGGLQEEEAWMSWAWLQDFFHGLHSKQRQVGLDDVLHPWFQQHSLAAQQACIQQGSIAGCRAILQHGATPGLRPQLWSTALAVQLPDDQIEQRFQQLCGQAEQCHLLTDLLIEQDLESAANSEHYFLFEEALRAVLLAASREPNLGPTCLHTPFPRLLGTDRNGESHGAYPPSGLLPCRGLVEYAAPLCYLYPDQSSCMAMFCSMYARFWCRLHVIDDTAGKEATLISLCALFLHLLQESEAEVAQHLQRVECPALLLGLPWIMTAFAGHLAVGEVLLLWDRIIAFDSLLLLPVLAVAVLAFRRQVLLAAESKEQVLSIMEDLSQLKVVPLLQGVLFSQ